MCHSIIGHLATQVVKKKKKKNLPWLRSRVQEIDSLILKIQRLSFITFSSISLFPGGVGKYHSLLNYFSEKVSGDAILTRVLLHKAILDCN